jgi:hypothetical protein
VMRCCLGSVAREYTDKEVNYGYRSKCQHCHEPFTLTNVSKSPTWVPDWQLEKETT